MFQSFIMIVYSRPHISPFTKFWNQYQHVLTIGSLKNFSMGKFFFKRPRLSINCQWIIGASCAKIITKFTLFCVKIYHLIFASSKSLSVMLETCFIAFQAQNQTSILCLFGFQHLVDDLVHICLFVYLFSTQTGWVSANVVVYLFNVVDNAFKIRELTFHTII